FNEWTFPKVCQLYGISDDPNPSIDVYPVFQCGSADLGSEKPKAVINHLMAELKLRQDVTPLDVAYEATKTIYSYCYLASGSRFSRIISNSFRKNLSRVEMDKVILIMQ